MFIVTICGDVLRHFHHHVSSNQYRDAYSVKHISVAAVSAAAGVSSI